MMPQPSNQYWFSAKRYGWGWGLPTSWQGWVVMAAWFLILIGCGLLVAGRNLPAFFLFIAFMTAFLVTIAYAKGDPAGRHLGRHYPRSLNRCSSAFIRG